MAVDHFTGLVINFRVRIPQKSVVMLGRASNLKILLGYAKIPCSAISIVEDPSVTQKRKSSFRSLIWKKVEAKLVSLLCLQVCVLSTIAK